MTDQYYNTLEYLVAGILRYLSPKIDIVADETASEDDPFSLMFDDVRLGVDEPADNEILIDPYLSCFYIDPLLGELYPEAEVNDEYIRHDGHIVEFMDNYGDEDLLVKLPGSVYGLGVLIDRKIAFVADFFRTDDGYEARNTRWTGLFGLAPYLKDPSSKRMFYHYRKERLLSLRAKNRFYQLVPSKYRDWSAHGTVSFPRVLLSLTDIQVDKSYVKFGQEPAPII